MKVILALTALVSTTLAAPFTTSRGAIENSFVNWMKDFDMAIEDSAEYLHRLGVFAENMKKVEVHNAGNHSYTMKLNQFAHLTADEFRTQYTGLAVPEVPADIPRVSFELVRDYSAEVASSVDWSSKGAVTSVKNQASCGSCWAFSTTGALEGAYYLKTGSLVSFSEQQLVSCDTTDSGCNGGLMDNAFSWIKNNGGLCKEDDYPYTSGSGSSGTCKTSCSAVSGSTVTGYTDVSPVPQVTPATESSMAAAVSQQPVSVAIEADQSSFQFYSSGVLTSGCGTSLDHGVLVVGYGTDSGTEYWKVKNSWGSSWGESGYIRLEKGNSQRGGMCGVLMAASYPLL